MFSVLCLCLMFFFNISFIFHIYLVYVICYMFYIIWCMLYVICYILYVLLFGYMLHVICYMLYDVIYYMLYADAERWKPGNLI